MLFQQVLETGEKTMDLSTEHRDLSGDLPLSQNAAVVLKKRYLKKDERGGRCHTLGKRQGNP